MIKPLESFADKYFGAFKIDKWPENLDEFAVEVMKKWWASQATRLHDTPKRLADRPPKTRRPHSSCQINERIRIDYQDSIHLTVAPGKGAKEIVSNDKDFNSTQLRRTF